MILYETVFCSKFQRFGAIESSHEVLTRCTEALFAYCPRNAPWRTLCQKAPLVCFPQIAKFKPSRVDSVRAEFRIKGAKNLVLRVTGGGTKTWTFLYRSPVSGKRAKLSIGEYPSRSLASARTEALVLTLAVEQGKDPLVERRADLGADTFAALAKFFMAEHLLRNARGGLVRDAPHPRGHERRSSRPAPSAAKARLSKVMRLTSAGRRRQLRPE